MSDYNCQEIGTIRTPYKKGDRIPIQSKFSTEMTGKIILKPEYVAGLKDLEGFSHAFLIYYFHQSREVRLQAKPFLENQEHGIFAIRGPHRPNHLGLSIVHILSIHDNIITFEEVDMFDETPLLDIKPYVKYFDNRVTSNNGWLEKHFNQRQQSIE